MFSWLRRPALALVLSVLALLSAGCKREPPQPRARSISAQIAEKIPLWRAPQQNQSDDRRRFKDAPVYLDGRRVGVIRPLEVPANLRPHMRIRAGAVATPRYSVAEYITAAGGDMAKVREVHLYGGRTRIAVVTGAEVRKHKEDLFFLFTGGARGKPRVGWPPDGIEVNASIDMVAAVAVYQDKEPPEYDPKRGGVHFADGKLIDGIPYAPNEELKGTRFYVDGLLAGWMKRKILPNSMLVPGSEVADGLFSLAAYVASLGVDPAKVKAIELVQDDDAVARVAGAALSREPTLTFTLPRRSQGNLVLWLPKATFPGFAATSERGVPVRISAVQLFVKSAPPQRTYAKIEDLVEVEKAGDRERPGAGSNKDQGEGDN